MVRFSALPSRLAVIKGKVLLGLPWAGEGINAGCSCMTDGEDQCPDVKLISA